MRASGSVSTADRVETPAGLLVPPTICKGIVTPGGAIDGNVFVPTEHDAGGEDEVQLRADLAAFVDRYVELPDGATVVAVEYILLSWVHDTFDELPYLAFRTADWLAGDGPVDTIDFFEPDADALRIFADRVPGARARCSVDPPGPASPPPSSSPRRFRSPPRSRRQRSPTPEHR